MNRIPFEKIQGLGNDFILIDNRESRINFAQLHVRNLCDRHFGIGADGVILAMPRHSDCDFGMKVLNADGSEAQMCGNGIRCLALFIYRISNETLLPIMYSIATGNGILTATVRSESLVEVNMGQPILVPELIPTTLNLGFSTPVVDFAVAFGGSSYEVTCVSMGNPHAVWLLCYSAPK